MSLNCEADGATSCTWERQSGSIPSGAIGVNTTTLTIINPTPEDADNYLCVSIDNCGSGASGDATITITSKLEWCELKILQHYICIYNYQKTGECLHYVSAHASLAPVGRLINAMCNQR